jgi:hypothetical protein
LSRQRRNAQGKLPGLRFLAALIWVALAAQPLALGAEAAAPAALDAVDIPDGDINFGPRQSIGDRPPPTGPLLHRAFARRWKESFEVNVARAASMVALAERGGCGRRASLNAPGWHDVLDSAHKEAARGALKDATIPQLAARHYMRASAMAENLMKGAVSAGCPAEQAGGGTDLPPARPMPDGG